MLKKLKQNFEGFVSPKTESAYPWIDRAIGLIPLAIGGVMCFVDSKYNPSDKIHYKYGPVALGVYGATQIGLTYAKDFVDKIENPYAKWTSDFVVGLIDAWNNVPIYVYANNMLPGKFQTNFILAYDYLPDLVGTVEGDIKTLVKGGKYEPTSWKLNTAFISGAISRNIADKLTEGYKDSGKDTFNSVVVNAVTASTLKEGLSGMLRPSKYETGRIEGKIMKGVAENIFYSDADDTFVKSLKGKLPWTGDDEAFGEDSAFEGMAETLLVETFFYLLGKGSDLIDNGVKTVHVACQDNPELDLCQEATFPLLEKSAAAA